jgi:hypothetical protein
VVGLTDLDNDGHPDLMIRYVDGQMPGYLYAQDGNEAIYANLYVSSNAAFQGKDLEGIVDKLKHGRYGEGWFKIRNPRYSQYEGRRELFERKRVIGAP